MSAVLRICRWEWFKLQRRRMPWILLAILFAFSQLSIWGGYANYAFNAANGGRVFVPNAGASPDARPGAPRMLTCRQLEEDPAALPADTPPQTIDALQRQCQVQKATLATRYQTLSPVGGINSTLTVASVLGLILLGVLSASAVGMEYGLGTLRPILTRGTGRLPYLAGKYLMLIGAATAALLILCAAAAGSGALVSQIAVAPPPGIELPTNSLSTVAVSFVKLWGALLAFVTMTGAITLLVRSTAIGMAISLGYYIAEGILIRLLSSAFDWFEAVADYLPMRNISALTSIRNNLPAAFAQGNDISTLQASLVLAAWVIVIAGIAAVVFRRRDVVGAVGS